MHVHVYENRRYLLTCLNSLGQTMFEKTVDANTRIPVEFLKSGMYLLKVSDFENGEIRSYSILKK